MCHWICVIGNQWVCDQTLGCACPEEETCLTPNQAGASGDKTQTPCLPIGSPGGG